MLHDKAERFKNQSVGDPLCSVGTGKAVNSSKLNEKFIFQGLKSNLQALSGKISNKLSNI
uniref:Uncharacterized protein n=1 Tax=Romanomermis culicivorax TaxID=13658 RepID=A0A915KBX0_ROMCU